MQPVVILVHGAMQTPEFFEPVRARLSDQGIPARTPQLPSSNADSGLLQSLTADVAVLRDAVRAASGPVVMVAASYGGVLQRTTRSRNPR